MIGMPLEELLITTLGPPILSWVLSNASLGRGKRSATRASAKEWPRRLEAEFRESVQVFGVLSREPSIVIEGEYELNEHQQQRRHALTAEVLAAGRPNDPHAILAGRPIMSSDPVSLRAQTTDFGGVLALREEGLRPPVLSSSAVIVCPSAELLILHQRGDVATYPYCVHTLGGAYMPPSAAKDPDRQGLRSTLEREVHEESQVSASIDTAVPMMLSQELEWGFIQLVFLGLPIPESALDRLSGNWEGSILPIRFDSLDAALCDEDWVPSGKAHVLAWLGAGAPGASPRARFGGMNAVQLFDRHVRPW
jgi:hypothetical protein